MEQDLSMLVGESWMPVVQPEFQKPYFKQLSDSIKDRRKITPVYPTPENVFSWTRSCKVNEVKVVILGQDPYHGPNQAHGLAFSVLRGVPIPPSLQNIFTELENDIWGFTRPNHGYLEGWAMQGVLMLNSVLTVDEGFPNSHECHGWECFTDAVISYLNFHSQGLVFMLWGKKAQEKMRLIEKAKHFILTAAHPSSQPANNGFFGCRHFSKCNGFLNYVNKTPINWNYLPEN